MQNPLRLRPLQRRWIIRINSHPLRLNRLDRSHKPLPCPNHPTAQRTEQDNPHRHRRIIHRLAIHGVQRRQVEHDGDEADPETGDDADGARQQAEVERAFGVPVGVDDGDEDRDAVRDVQADGGDGGGGAEGDGGAERGDREEECQRGGEPDGADGTGEAGVDFVEEGWETAVAGEAEHHSGFVSTNILVLLTTCGSSSYFLHENIGKM